MSVALSTLRKMIRHPIRRTLILMGATILRVAHNLLAQSHDEDSNFQYNVGGSLHTEKDDSSSNQKNINIDGSNDIASGTHHTEKGDSSSNQQHDNAGYSPSASLIKSATM
jgi:hypothetical protein